MRRVLCSLLLIAAAAAPAGARAAEPSTVRSPLTLTAGSEIATVAVDGTTAYIGGSFRHVGPLTGGFAQVSGDGEGALARQWPVVDGLVLAVAADGDGGFYIGGTFRSVGGVARERLAHLRADGTVDPAWNPGVDNVPQALTVFGGRVWVGGVFTEIGGQPRTNLAALDAETGEPSATVATGGADGVVTSFAQRPGSVQVGGQEARLFAGGTFSSIDGVQRRKLAAFDAAGEPVDDFTDAQGGFNGDVLALATENAGSAAAPSHRLYVGGSFSLWGPVAPRSGLASFNANGTLTTWNPDPPGADDHVVDLSIDGEHVYFARSASVRRVALDGAAPPIDAWEPVFDSFFVQVNAVLVRGGVVHVGGLFFGVGADLPRTNAAAFSTAPDAAPLPWDPEPGNGNGVYALVPGAGGTVVAAGEFTTAGGTPRRHLAAIDLLSGTLLPFAPQPDDVVETLDVEGPTLYAGGRFTKVGAAERAHLAAFDTATGALTGFDARANDPVGQLDATPVAVFATGSFSSAGAAVPRDGVASFTPGTGALRDFDPAITGNVLALAARGDTAWLGGTITALGDKARDGVVAVRDVPGTEGAPLAFAPDTDGFVTDLAPDGGLLHIAGQGNAGTGDRDLQTVDAADGAARGPAVSVDGLPGAVARAGDLVFAGGNFSTAAGAPRSGLAAIVPGPATLAPWASPVGGGIGNAILDLAASDAAGLVAVGSMREVDFLGGGASSNIVAFAMPPARPAAPTTSPGPGRISVAVGPPPPGGAPITEYAVTVSPGGRRVTSSSPSMVIGDLANGTGYTVTATAANRVGTSPPSPPSAAVTPQPAAPDADTTAPVISGLELQRKRFRLGKRKTPRVAAKRGTRFSFRVSEPARTTITIARKRGERLVTRFKLQRATVAGRNRVAFTGKVGRKRLKPGRHRATLRAVDAAGNRSAPRRIRFRVVRR